MRLPGKRKLAHKRAPIKVAKTDPATGETVLVNRKGRERSDPFFRRLEQSMEKEEFMDIIACAGDEKALRLFKMMLEPRYSRWSLARLAVEAGITYAELTVLIKNRHLGEGTIRMSTHAPRVMEDVAIDSMSKEVTCASCKGHKVEIDGEMVAVIPVTEVLEDEQTKKRTILQKLDEEGVPVWERCLTCDGVGTLRKVGDADARKLMFETLKLTGQRGPLVAIQNNTGGAPSMEDSVGAAHDVLDVPVLKESNNDQAT